MFNAIVVAHFEKDETRKKELSEKIANETWPTNLKRFDERIAKSGSGYIASCGLTWVDLYLYSVLEFLGEHHDAVVANFKNVKAMEDKIRANPGVAAWLARRPKTDH